MTLPQAEAHHRRDDGGVLLDDVSAWVGVSSMQVNVGPVFCLVRRSPGQRPPTFWESMTNHIDIFAGGASCTSPSFTPSCSRSSKAE